MMTINKQPRGAALAFLKRKLPSILTMSEGAVDELVEVAPAETAELVEVLRTFNKGIRRSREWLDHAMVSLPLECWRMKDGRMSVHNVTGASLKYASTGSFLEDLASEPQFLTREQLCRSLFSALDEQRADLFRPIAEWNLLRLPSCEMHPLLADVRVADSIYVVDYEFFATYAKLEKEHRDILDLAMDEPTPPMTMRWLADHAQDMVFSKISGIVQSAVGGDNLIIRMLCNIAANRALLESAQKAAHAEKASKLLVPLLEVMNRNGIFEVPEVKDDAGIKKTLSAWFGAAGLLRKEAYFDRNHDAAEKSLELTMRLAEQVQTYYIRTRGWPAGIRAEEAYGGPCNKLIFALGIVACAYAGIDVEEELFGQHDRERKAYPARGRNRYEPLGAHSVDLFASLFGHMAFSNVGWSLSARHVEDYSRALAYKRSCLQEIIFLVFKRFTAYQLLTLHNALMQQ